MTKSPELLPCPFGDCQIVTITDTPSDLIRCEKHTHWITREQWNTRSNQQGQGITHMYPKCELCGQNHNPNPYISEILHRTKSESR